MGASVLRKEAREMVIFFRPGLVLKDVQDLIRRVCTLLSAFRVMASDGYKSERFKSAVLRRK